MQASVAPACLVNALRGAGASTQNGRGAFAVDGLRGPRLAGSLDWSRGRHGVLSQREAPASVPGTTHSFVELSQATSRANVRAAAQSGDGFPWMGMGPAAGSPEAAKAAKEAAEAEWKAEGSADKSQFFLLSVEIPEGDPFADDKIDIVEQAGLTSPCAFELRLPQPVTDTLLAYLRLAALSGPDAFLLEALFRRDVWGHLQKPVSRENEEGLCRTMIEGCAGALASYPTSLEEDTQRLEQELSAEERTALMEQIGERRVLEGVLAAFELRLRSADTLEYYAERRLKDLGLLDKSGAMTPWASADY